MRFDIHAHLAGVGTGGSGCWLSPRTRARPVFRLLRRLNGVTERQLAETFDQDWAARLAAAVRESELDRAVALGFDGVYDARGERVEADSQLIVPPAWVFQACRRHPELLPGPSINPFRRDALERLEECAEGGAVLIKWLPIAQGIDPSSPRLRPFYRRVAELGIPLLIHAGGGEMTFREVAPELGGVERLRAPLEQGVTVICAHSGVPVRLRREPDQLPLVRELLERHPNFWVDNSGMANPSRFPYLPRLARDPLFRARTLYGSDFPVPAVPLLLTRSLGARRAVRLQRERNPLQRDVLLKRELGYPDESLTRARTLLANLDRWGIPPES
jgi:predicted TIM-barrel fold metal-dependent hydrolase